MAKIMVKLETPVEQTFRVAQVAGMFDVPVEERMRHELMAEVPGVEEAWTIGAIVGPSGSGKTTLAREAFGAELVERLEWPKGRAIVEVLGEVDRRDAYPTTLDRRDAYPTTKEIGRVLIGVGLGSVPTWLKPYEILSTGEKFRANLARAILSAPGGTNVLVVDEFTSSLDRTVAQTASAAVGRFLRESAGGLKLVAVTCHEDVLPWLDADWVLRLEHGGPPRLTWRSLWQGGREKVRLRVHCVPQATWKQFARHHYLAGALAASATCYAAWWNERPVAFCAAVAALGWKKTKRITRLVVLPEFQGLGIGGPLAFAVARHQWLQGHRVTITASHPAMVAHCSRSPNWRFVEVKKCGSTRQRMAGREIRSSMGRAVATFEFVGA